MKKRRAATTSRLRGMRRQSFGTLLLLVSCNERRTVTSLSVDSVYIPSIETHMTYFFGNIKISIVHYNYVVFTAQCISLLITKDIINIFSSTYNALN